MPHKFYINPFILLSFLVLMSFQIRAQQESRSPNYSKQPYWIEMMNDPNVNYFEAVKAYDEFWAERKKPIEEDEKIGQNKSIESKGKLKSKRFRSKEEREKEESKKYLLDVKKFEHWKLTVQPYVQEDGRILSADEQLKLWEDQRKK